MSMNLYEAFKLTEEAWTEQEPNSQINEATAVGTTYFVEVDSGHGRTQTPNCTLDSAIKHTRRDLVDSLGYYYITWTDEATGKVVFEYIPDIKVIKTKISAAKTELQGVLDALRGSLYSDLIGNVVYDNFTEDERRYLNNDLEALRAKIKEIQMSRELKKFPL